MGNGSGMSTCFGIIWTMDGTWVRVRMGWIMKFAPMGASSEAEVRATEAGHGP